MTSLAAVLSLIVASAETMGQSDPQYIIYDLGIIGGTTTTAESRALGINELGEVCGQSTATTGGQKRAFVWLFNAAYGLSAQTMHDLNVLESPDFSGETAAEDINNDGRLAGRVGAEFSGAARLWTLSSGGATGQVLPPIDSGGWAHAKALNDEDENGWTWIIGTAQDENDCGAGVLDYKPARWILKPPPDGLTGPVALIPPDPPGPENNGVGEGRDINNNVDSAPGPDVVGSATPCGAASVQCQSTTDAAHWTTPSNGQEMSGIDDPGENFAVSVNDVEDVVGWGYEDVTIGGTCRLRALYWSSIGANPENIGIADGFDTDHGTIANAINNVGSGARHVVGRDTTDNVALLWHGTANNWNVYDLNTTLPDFDSGSDVDPCGWDQLIEATDVNQDGWIVGYGARNLTTGGGPIRAFLLEPVTACVFDLSGDCKVNGSDLGLLLLAWGTCPSGSSCMRCRPNTDACTADFDCNGKVDGGDLGQLELHWTGTDPCGPDCESGEGFAPGGGGEGSEAGGEPPANLNQILQELLDTSYDDLAAWLIEFYGTGNL